MVVGHESYQQIGADFNEFCRSIMYLAKISCFSYSCKIFSLLIHKRIYDFTTIQMPVYSQQIIHKLCPKTSS